MLRLSAWLSILGLAAGLGALFAPLDVTRLPNDLLRSH
jgi:hypothetical protein